MPIQADQVRSMRLGVGITVGEAAALVQVSKRTWESWESGLRNMPDQAVSTFALRLTHSAQELEAAGVAVPTRETHRGLVVLVDVSGGIQRPCDVVARDNFLDVVADSANPACYVVSSLAVERSGKPYVHRTRVARAENVGAINALEGWKVENERIQSANTTK